MKRYYELIEEAMKIGEGEQASYAYRDLLNQMKINYEDINETEGKAQPAKTKLFILLKKGKGKQYFKFISQLLELLYLKDSFLLRIIYQFVPTWLQKFLIDEVEAQFQNFLKVMSRSEAVKAKGVKKARLQMSQSEMVKELERIHFGKAKDDKIEQKSIFIEKIDEENSIQINIREVLLNAVYRNVKYLEEQAVKDLVGLILVYCGGQAINMNWSSIYWIEKRNQVSIFKLGMREQEFEWLLLSLYELSLRWKQMKYELLASISMLYKKTANQSLFKLSQIAQSIVHLLQDEYLQTFS